MKTIRICLLLLLPGLFLYSQEDVTITPTHEAGYYSQDILLFAAADRPDVRLYFRFDGAESDWLAFRDPLRLSALPGEERPYRLWLCAHDGSEFVGIRQMDYTIDKRTPSAPEINLSPGEYDESLNLLLDGDEEIFYSVNANILDNPERWENRPIYLDVSESGSERYLVQAFCRDAAGNRSPVVSYDYVLRTPDPEKDIPSLSILSPVSGEFANYQMLYILSRNVEWVRYTLDGKDPVHFGTQYSKPLNLIATGDVQLIVAAKTHTGEILKQSVSFTIRPEYPLKITSDVQSGIHSGPIEIKLYASDEGELHYTFDERTPDISDRLFEESIVINTIPHTLKHTTLRLRTENPDSGWGREYRYFFGIDARTEEIQQPEVAQEAVPEDFSLQIDGVKNGGLQVQLELTSNGRRRVVYEVSADAPAPAPTAESPSPTSRLIVDVPQGMERTVYFSFASVDSEGAVRMEDDTIAVTVDRKPPNRPLLSPAPGTFDYPVDLVISGSGNYRYSLTEDGSVPSEPDVGSLLYQDNLQLSGSEGVRKAYTLKLQGHDDFGNVSEVFGPFQYVIDLETPTLPGIRGIEDGGIYNSKSVVLSLTESEYHVHYTILESAGVLPDPDKDAPELTSTLDFTGEEGEVINYQIKLLPYSSHYKLAGSVSSIEFTIDLKSPDPPSLSGVTDGGRYRGPVTVTAGPTDDGDTVYISHSVDGEDPPDPVTFGQPYESPLIFDVEKGEEHLVILRTVSVSRNGNRSYPDRYYRFTMDKKPPSVPSVSGLPSGGITGSPVEIGFSENAGQVYYSLTEDGSPPLPSIDDEDHAYTSEIVVDGIDGEETTYKIIAIAVDDLGNAGEATEVETFIIDLTPPPDPEAPEVLDFWDGSIRRILVAWDVPYGQTYHYSLDTQTDKFQLYQQSLLLDYAAEIFVKAYSEDLVGNRSEERVFTLYPVRKPEPPTVGGIVTGGIVNTAVNLTVDSPEGIVRYEISLDDILPQDVTPHSLPAPPSMQMNVDPGENHTYRLKFRVYLQENDRVFSDQFYLTFTIDRSPPPPPEVAGIIDGGYYLEQVELRFEPDTPEDMIYYRLYEEAMPGAASYIPYEKAPTVLGTDGEMTAYLVSVYAVDTAGNRSSVERNYRFFLDRKGVYVSASGDDNSPGTREKPFRSIQRAIDFSKDSGRKMVYVAAGEYLIHETVDLQGEFILLGGLSSADWKQTVGITHIIGSKYFEKGRSLILMHGGRIRITHIHIDNPLGIGSSLLKMEAGELEIESSRFSQGSLNRGIEQFDGNLILRDCLLEAVQSSNLVWSEGSRFSAYASTFRGPERGGEFTCLSFDDVEEIRLENVSVSPGGGDITRAIQLNNSTVYLTDSHINGGTGEKNAIVVELTNSRFTADNTVIQCVAGARYGVGILAEESRINLTGCRLELSGRYGTIGVKAGGGVTEIMKSRIHGYYTQEFIYLISVERGQGRFFNNVLTGGEASDSVCVYLSDSQTDWFNNTIIGGTGRTSTIGFRLRSSRKSRFANNILVRRKGTIGSAFHVVGDLPEELKAHCLYGWNLLMEVADGRAGTSASIEELNYVDGKISGGSVDGHISESPFQIFSLTKETDSAEVFSLSPDSSCINTGVDISGPPYNGPLTDWEGETRLEGIGARYDIGADEYR